MSRPQPHVPFLLPLTVALIALALPGCGSSIPSGVAELQGGAVSIGHATLNHWMRVKLGFDSHESIASPGPAGLVSEPADYAECAREAKALVPKAPTGAPKLNEAQIQRGCRALYMAVKAQALSFLISAQWTLLEATKQGVHLSDAVLQKEFARYRKETYPEEGALQRYLAERHWLLSDLLYEFKIELLNGKLGAKFEDQVKQAGGAEATFTRLALQRAHRQAAATRCEKGYVVAGCRGYREPVGGEPSPFKLLEGLVAGKG